MQSWLYAANVKYYDVLKALEADLAIWPQNSKVAVGDQLFIYLAAPYKQIGYKAEIVKIDLEEDEIIEQVRPYFIKAPDGSKSGKKFMKIKLLERYELSENSLLGLTFLREHGLNGMLMGPRKLDNNPALLEYVGSVTG